MKGLSIVVAATGDCHPTAFLAALEAEGITCTAGVDVHIAFDQSCSLHMKPQPDNLHLHPCPTGTSILKLWGMAIACSRQEYIAVLDIHCPPMAGWFQRVMYEVRRGTRLFFGPVNSAWAPADRRIVGYITEYAQFHAPLAKQLNEVPGNNLVCHRSLLNAPNMLIERGFLKTFMIWKLAREQDLVPERFNDMVVAYRKPFQLGSYLAQRKVHGRCFAAHRHDNPKQPPRVLCIVFTPLLPILRVWRIYKAVRRDRVLTSAFVIHLPGIVLSEAAWSLGELLGYAFGEEGACESLK